MVYDYNRNYGSFVRDDYAYPDSDYELNPNDLNFGLNYSGTVAAVWVGSNPNQYAYCELDTDTSLSLGHSSGSLTSFTTNANTVTVNAPTKISLNTPVVECSTEIKAQLGTFTSLSAPYKMFDIAHPSKKNKRLRHVCLEGPEISVFIKGKLTNDSIIKLPDYWEKLVDPDSINVSLTQIGVSQDLIVENVDLKKKQIKVKANTKSKINCYYTVIATRIDVSPLEVEIDV